MAAVSGNIFPQSHGVWWRQPIFRVWAHSDSGRFITSRILNSRTHDWLDDNDWVTCNFSRRIVRAWFYYLFCISRGCSASGFIGNCCLEYIFSRLKYFFKVHSCIAPWIIIYSALPNSSSRKIVYLWRELSKNGKVFILLPWNQYLTLRSRAIWFYDFSCEM